ncbi:hypothetical protein MMC13_001487 [Lambiella insularis]|nr:hypothetical protein [Lambiella insularis]
MATRSLATSMLQVTQPGRIRASFSQLVSDGQFAALGLVLVATVAEINVLLLPVAPRDDVEGLITVGASRAMLVDTHRSSLEDLGQRIARRPEISRDGEESSLIERASLNLRGEVEVERETAKSGERADHGAKEMNSRERRRLARQKASRTRNAVDEIFSGLD